MSFPVRSLLLATLVIVPTSRAASQNPTQTLALRTVPPSSATVRPVSLEHHYTGPRSERTDALMAQWDIALRLTTRRACFRGETDPATSLVNMVSLATQSESVPPAERDAVVGAIYNAWHDVVDHGGCAGLEAPPFQVLQGVGDARWFSAPNAASAQLREERDASGRLVATMEQLSAYGRSVTRRSVYDGAAGAERLVGAQDVLPTTTGSCINDMTQLAAEIGGAHPELPSNHTYHVTKRSLDPMNDRAVCEAFADTSAASSAWTIDFVNAKTSLVEVGLRLRRTAEGQLEIVANYPGVGYQ